MTWFRADDTLHSHPKTRRAGLAAMGLWTMAGTYAMSYRTDGFVPDWYVKSWPNGARLAADLVHADLWSPATHNGEKGWQFHDWHDYQPTLGELDQRDGARDTKNVAKARAGRLGAHRRWHREPVPDCPYCKPKPVALPNR